MGTGARTVEHRLHVSRLHAQRAEFHFFSVRRHAPRPSRRLIDSSSVDARLTRQSYPECISITARGISTLPPPLSLPFASSNRPQIIFSISLSLSFSSLPIYPSLDIQVENSERNEFDSRISAIIHSNFRSFLGYLSLSFFFLSPSQFVRDATFRYLVDVRRVHT